MISIIIPFYNEENNLVELARELVVELKKTDHDYELLFIDDGSVDKSADQIKAEATKNKHIKVFHHRKRMGKGEGLNTGIKHAKGSIIFFMDGDLQNDPKDIHKFLKKIDEGYDFVNGIRNKRDDHGLIRLYSSYANKFLKKFVNSPFTDINTAFKAMRREVLDEFVLYGNNFRFLPLAIYLKGYKVSEVLIHNRPRIHGKSKFGVMKVFTGLFDTFTAYFLYRFSERPLVFFGSVGGAVFATGAFMATYMAFERIFYNVLLYRRPALQLAVLLIIVGLQIILTGFIGELIVYTNKRKHYK